MYGIVPKLFTSVSLGWREGSPGRGIIGAHGAALQQGLSDNKILSVTLRPAVPTPGARSPRQDAKLPSEQSRWQRGLGHPRGRPQGNADCRRGGRRARGLPHPDVGPRSWWPCQLGALRGKSNPAKPSGRTLASRAVNLPCSLLWLQDGGA